MDHVASTRFLVDDSFEMPQLSKPSPSGEENMIGINSPSESSCETKYELTTSRVLNSAQAAVD